MLPFTSRYNSLNQYLRKRFDAKVFKVSLDAKFTCPNRDGTKGLGGCIYCNPKSNSALELHEGTIKEQLIKGVEYLKKRHLGSTKFIAYLQQYTNTYGKASELEKIYNEAIEHPDVVGLAISTRPDCLSDEILKILGQLNSKTFLWLELGLQSSHDRSLKLINRGHGVIDFEDAVLRAHEAGIMTCAHIILGLPCETHADMLETAKYLTNIKIGGVKIHNLHVLKETKLAQMYERGELKLLSQEEYVSLVVDFLEWLDPKILIHRFNSHSPKDLTIAPLWSINKMGTLTAVHKELERRDTYQGKCISVANPSF